MSSESEQMRIGNVLHPVGDVPGAIAFYQAFGLPLKFQDGDRYAAFDAGTTTFAVAGEEENLTAGQPAVSFRVTDVDATVRAAVAAGASVVLEPTNGPHERRAVLKDPWQNAFIVYSPLPRQ